MARAACHLAVLGLALCLVLAALPAAAQAPHHRWTTMETPHFVLHYHEGLYPVALRAARGLERAHETLVPLLGGAPRRKTQVVISDDTDSANGSASAFGRPWISLLAEPPDAHSVLGDTDDYLWMLVAHEYVHVLHLGRVEGVPSLLNTVFGDVFIPNGLQPRFIVEGLATYQESHVSGGGRIRSSLFDMYLRADFLEDRVLDLGQLTNGPDRWPWGTAWYLYGGRLIEWLAATKGDEALERYSALYGSSVIPWAVNVDLRQVADTDWIEIFDEWEQAMGAHYEEQRAAIEAAGPVTAPTFATTTGERTRAPRWMGDELAYLEVGPSALPRLRVADPRTGADRLVRELGGSGTIAPLPDGRVLLARSEVTEVYQVFGDLFVVDERGERRLTKGLRASEIDASPDGRQAVFVQRGQGRTRLARISLDDPERGAEILHDPGERVLYTPRYRPDGQAVVFSMTRPRGPGRDLFELDLGSGDLRQLTDDEAYDLDPTYTPDGEAVVFSSDRTGIFDLYRQDRTSGKTVQLTNVLTGAFQPDVSPDGSWIAWTTYSSRGFDVAAAPFDSLQPAPASPRKATRPPSPAPVGGDLYPVRPYDPLETLGPQTWFPWVGSDATGSAGGISVGGEDIVGRHAWSLSAGLGVESMEPHLAAGYSYRGLFPRLSLALASSYRNVAGQPPGTTERVNSGGVSLAFPWASTLRSHAFRVGWQLRHFDPVDFEEAFAPEEGISSELHLGFGFSSTERPALAISPENGVALDLSTRFASAALGSDFDWAALELGAGGYLRLPWGDHHVLALIGRAGISEGDLGRRRVFSLGGPRLRDPLLDLLYTGSFMGGTVLRGYGPAAFAGSNLAIGTVEYRFPIWRADTGAWTLPLYAGRLSGALFAEAGDAWDGLTPHRLHPSAGAELRWELLVGWLRGVVHLGYGHGFDVDQGGGHRVWLAVGTGG